jgi:hypothetical protein
MDPQKDFADLCSLLNAKGVDYLIVGGYAVAFHGAPRFTGDLDIFVRPNAEHANRLLGALHEFGFPAHEVTASELLEQRRILQLGRVPVQIHVMTSITGVDWDEAWASRERGTYGGDVPVLYIGREALLANKRAAGRIKDLADVQALERGDR